MVNLLPLYLFITMYRCTECYDQENKNRRTTIQQFLEKMNVKIQVYTQDDNSLNIECKKCYTNK